MPKSFKDLKVWHRSLELTMLIYQLTSSFPREELFGLTSQMRRAAVSISSNIAEGSARATRKDFRQFVIIARGSCSELQTQLLIVDRLRYGDQSCLQAAQTLSDEVGRMLNGLSKFLKSPSLLPAKPKN